MSKQKKTRIKNKNNSNNKTNKREKITKFLKVSNDWISIITSIVALIVSGISYSFTKSISPLTYFCEENSKTIANTAADESAEVTYNISSMDITINNFPGAVAEIYLADVANEKVDIYCIQKKDSDGIILNDQLMLFCRYTKSISKVTLSINFSNPPALKSGYFFVIFKSYSGNYYYNIIHYIAADTSYMSDSLRIVEVDTEFLKMQNIYSRGEIQLLCDEINQKNYTKNQVDVDSYTQQIENDYQKIKSKLEN